MDIFSDYKVEKEKDGYIVKLYINNNSTEFANEFNHLKDERFTKLYNSVQDYVDDKFSNIKVNAARVFLGSLPVAEVLIEDKVKKEEGPDKYDASILYHGEHFDEEDSLWTIAQKFES